MRNMRYLADGITISNDTRRTGLNNNDMIIGSSGSGKTGSYVIPNLQNITGSMVVSDTKGQLHRMFSDELKAKGYSVYTLDLVDPLSSCGYNPLSGIRRYDNGKLCEKDIADARQGRAFLGDGSSKLHRVSDSILSGNARDRGAEHDKRLQAAPYIYRTQR